VSLSNYWPSLKEIDYCVRTQAETADEAILLAVHEPARISRRAAFTNVVEEADEQAMLAAFMTPNLAGGSLLLPITGVSGVGKSHMIRWLDAQLRRQSRSSSMHIITIPKSASLRQVVELILEPLKGSEYDELREELRNSMASVSDGAAAIRLGSEIKIALQHKQTLLEQTLRSGGTGGDTQAVRNRLQHARSLPALIQDSALEEHFMHSVLPRIVRRALHGIKDDSDAEQETPQFVVEDFENLEEKGLRGAAHGVHLYYSTVLNALGGENRKTAVRLLNESALDMAIRGVFNLGRSASGMTVEDVVNRIREQLLKDGKELVLLVEDFAALAGIQETLLNLSIVEATHAGEQVRAPMRTALALTDGYLSGRDTILTRAGYEWQLRSRFGNDEEVIGHCVNLVGRYLNAARWGAEQLRDQYRASRHGEHGLTDWVQCYTAPMLTAEDSDTLAAFGNSDRGHPLFPFNRAAISGLCQGSLPRSGGLLEFNPRALIDRVIRDVLLQRGDYERGQFPEPSFKSPKLSPDVRVAVTDSGLSSAEQSRVVPVLCYWGGNPETREEAYELSSAIFGAFSIKRPFATRPPRRKRESVSPPPPGPSPGPIAHSDPPDLDNFRVRLRTWADGGALNQSDARDIRNEWARALRERIDETELHVKGILKDIRSLAGWIYIPGAQVGNPPVNDSEREAIRLCSEERDPSGRVQIALIAMRRRLHHKGWNFPGGEGDFACYAWLLDRLAEQVPHWMLREASRRLKYLVPRLRWQSILLGLESTDSNQHIEMLAAPSPEIESPVQPYPQDLDLYATIVQSAREARKTLQEQVYRCAACYQGSRGTHALALDEQRLLAAIEDDASTDAIMAGEYSELREHLNQLTATRLGVAARKAARWARATATKIVEGLGEDNPKAILDALRAVAESVISQGFQSESVAPRAFSQSLERLETAWIASVQSSAQKLTTTEASDDLISTLKTLAHVPMQSFQKLLELITDAEQLLGTMERGIEAQRGTLEGVDTVVAAQNVSSLFRAADEVLKVFDHDVA
jgi:hypothetical protein